MARPHKEGLDYFSFDVDFFENKKVRRIMRACGPASGTILTCLLCNIYQGKGYYISWDEELPFDIADKIGVSEGAVSEVINKSVQVDFFSIHQYEKNKILTSKEIQKRYKSATGKRHEVFIDEKYTVFTVNNDVNGGRNPVNGGDSTQSKVKKSKEKESKEENGAGAPPLKSFKNFSDEDFVEELKKFKDDYSKEMLNAFYKYWKEKSAGGKMRFQLEKTWETKLRLDKWESNQENFKNGNNNHSSNGKPVPQKVSAGGFGKL